MPTKLGQNFLKNQSIIKKIVESANLTPDDLVVEIGPGKGILTEELAKQAGKVITIEIDRNLIPELQNKFKGYENVEIINADILKINLQELLRSSASKYKVVANLPYYITSPIIRLFLESENPPSEMILMVQKEVAERIVALPSEIPADSRGAKRISRGKPGQMSILAVSVQYYADAEILFYVGKENFEPVPQVDSCVIRIKPSPPASLPERERGAFFRVVKAGFSAKRKMLVNNLANSLHMPKTEVEEKLKKAGINPTVRAQELSIEEWKRLATLFS